MQLASGIEYVIDSHLESSSSSVAQGRNIQSEQLSTKLPFRPRQPKESGPVRSTQVRMLSVKSRPRSKHPEKAGPAVPDKVLEIERRRNAFFIAKKKIILPLLPEENLISRLMEDRGEMSASIRPYWLLLSQPSR